jgi:hypothetical protein
MPRLTSSGAFALVDRVLAARWRCLVRNPRFRDALKRLADMRTRLAEEIYEREYRRTLLEWRLQYIPWRALTEVQRWSQPNGTTFLDALWREETSPGRGDLNLEAIFPPLLDCGDVDQTGYLSVRIDMTFPVDVIVEALAKKIRMIRKESSRPRRRQRPDRISFQLSVYDRVAVGENFLEIARALREPASTVKSAYVACNAPQFAAHSAELSVSCAAR